MRKLLIALMLKLIYKIYGNRPVFYSDGVYKYGKIDWFIAYLRKELKIKSPSCMMLGYEYQYDAMLNQYKQEQYTKDKLLKRES